MSDTANRNEMLKFFSDAKQYERLLSASIELLSNNPENGTVLKYLANAYAGLDMYDECIKTCYEALRHLTDSSEKAYVFAMLANIYEFQKKFDEALPLRKEALALFPNYSPYAAGYALTLARSGKKDEAKIHMELAFKSDPNDYYVLSHKFRMYHELFYDKEVEREVLERMLLLSSDPFRMNIYFGNFHDKYGEDRAAYDFYVKAVLINPNHEDLNNKLLSCEKEHNISLLRDELLRNLNPEYSDELRALFSHTDYQKYKAFYRRIFSMGERNPSFLLFMAYVEFQLKDYSSCEFIAQKVIGTEAEDYIYSILGQIYFIKKKYEKSLLFLEKSLKVNPRSLNDQIFYSRCLAELGRQEDALIFLEDTVYFKMRNILHLHNRYIILYKFADDFEKEFEAIDMLEKRAVQLGKPAQYSMMYRAMTCEKYGRFEDALDYINKSVVIWAALGSNPLNDKIKARIKTSIQNGGEYGRNSVFSIFKRKESGRQTYPLPTWKII